MRPIVKKRSECIVGQDDDNPLDDPRFIDGFDTGREVQKIFDEPTKWSEEDEKIRRNLMSLLANMRGDRITEETYQKYYPWLNALRPSWKPSEEQLNALNFAITYFMHETNYKNPTELRELYDDLLKLK